MSKLTRKCPNCGATMPADVKYCRKCHAKLDSGRVTVLTKPSRREERVRPEDDDALWDLPRPVRPREDDAPRERRDGFFTPERRGAESGDAGPDRRGRMDDYARDVRRPVSTARGGEDEDTAAPRRSQKNLWQMAAVLAVILVVIVAAVVLVVRLNRPADTVQSSQPFEEETQDAAATQLPVATPEATAEPTATPEPTVTPEPSQEPAPSPAGEADGAAVVEANETVYLTRNGVNIRSGPGKNYQALGNENAGYELKRTGRADNGWDRVQYEGKEAYVAAEFLSTTKPAEKTSNTPAYTVTEASGTVKTRTDSNLRLGPSTNYGVYTTVATGTELTRTGNSGGWTRVSYDNKTLFISSDLLENGGLDVEAMSGTVTISKNEVRIRSGPGTGYSKLGTVNSGLTLTLTGKYSNWYQVTYNGQTGYVRDDLATKN